MNRAHSVIAGACSWLAGHTGALIVGVAVVWMAAVPSPVWGQWSGTNPVWTNSNVGIGTTNPENKLHVEGVTVLHFDDWGNDTLIFRGQKSTANQWGEYAIRTVYTGLDFRNTQTGNTLLHIGGGGGTSANTYLNPSGGNVGIGTTNPQYKLTVNGNIGAQDIIVTNTGWSDYVFRPGYRLRPLSEVSAYIQANGHLPEIPTEAEVKEKGVSLGDMQAKLLAKVEEITLHMIQADERNGRLEQQNQELRDHMAQQEKQNRELLDRLARLEKAATTDSTPAVVK